MRSKCSACDKHLGTRSVIFAIEGVLYCSANCGISDLRDKYGRDAGVKFRQFAEEINPQDIGIEPVSRVVDILCRRDGISFEDAEKRVAEVRELLKEANGSYDAAEEILANELGLEMDYIMDIL